jgi:Ca-activated chloride channel homolog
MKALPIIGILFLFFGFFQTNAQNSASQIKQGNKAFEEGKFVDAELLYRRAMEADNKWEKQALFNLAGTLYKQEKFDESVQLLNTLSQNESLSDKELSQVYHNLGNAMLMQKKYQESIDAYKKALRLNPKDEDSRYNLSYALKKLQQQQNENQDQNQNGDDKQDQDDKQEQDQDDKQDQNKDDKQDQNNQQDKDKKDEGDKNKPQPQQMSKQDMERMMNALSGKDRSTLEQMREKQMEKGGYKPEKDW